MRPAKKGEPCVAHQCGSPVDFGPIACDETRHVCVDLPTSGPCLAGALFPCNMLVAYCDNSATPPTCKPYTAPGAACSLGNECQPITNCAPSASSPTGKSCQIPADPCSS
jgi:hypothetical protein